jgi:superfamily II DNA or RNA helicase
MLYKTKGTLDEMHEFLKEKYPQFTYHIIKGEIDTKEREEIRRSIEKSTGNIIIATYGTMKQGVNIKLLHNLVFAEFSKSMYEVVQSIGRIVRPHKDKKLAVVYDICDDASYYTKPRRGGAPKLKQNYSMKHADVRLKYFQDDEIPVTDINLSGIYTATVDADQVEKKKEAAKKRAAKKNAKKKAPTKGKGKKSKFLS